MKKKLSAICFGIARMIISAAGGYYLGLHAFAWVYQMEHPDAEVTVGGVEIYYRLKLGEPPSYKPPPSVESTTVPQVVPL